MFPEIFSFELFGRELPLRTFGLVVAVGFLVGFWWGTRLSFRYGSDPAHDHEKIPDLAWWVLLGAIGGARLAYVLVNLDEFTGNPLKIFAIWEGGLVMYGGLILAFVLAYWKVRQYGFDPWMTADYGLTAGFLGQGIGRIGCLAVGDDFGAPSTLPWALRVPDPLPKGSLFPAELIGLTVHPTQIYMSLKGLALFALGMWLLRHRRFKGQVACILLGGYAVLRYLIETVRWDSVARGGIFKQGLSPADAAANLQRLGVADAQGRITDVERYRELLQANVEGIHPELLISTSQMIGLVLLPTAIGLYWWLRRRPGAALPPEDGTYRGPQRG